MTVSHGGNHDEIATDTIGDVVGKNGAVDSAEASRPLPPEHRLLHNQAADLENLAPEPLSQAFLLRLVLLRRLIELGRRLRQKIQRHRRKRRSNSANTSDAGTLRTSPAS
jgi:hypothetical protein